MSPSRRPLAWLLTLALLASQWLLLAHDARHLAPQDKAHACSLCLHHAGQDLIAGGAAAALPVAPGFTSPRPVARPTAGRQPLRAYRSRAPPLALA